MKFKDNLTGSVIEFNWNAPEPPSEQDFVDISNAYYQKHGINVNKPETFKPQPTAPSYEKQPPAPIQQPEEPRDNSGLVIPEAMRVPGITPPEPKNIFGGSTLNQPIQAAAPQQQSFGVGRDIDQQAVTTIKPQTETASTTATQPPQDALNEKARIKEELNYQEGRRRNLLTPEMRATEDRAKYLFEESDKFKAAAIEANEKIESILSSKGKEVDGNLQLSQADYDEVQNLKKDLDFNKTAYDKMVADANTEYSKLKPQEEKQKESQGFFERKGKMIAGSFTGLAKSTGDALRMIGIKETGKNISRSVEKFEDNYLHVYDPDFLDQITQGMASTATFFIPGLAVVKGAKLFGATTKVAAILGASSSSVLESAQEAGNVYNQNIASGMDHSTASQKATDTFLMNLPLNAVLDNWMFKGLEGTKGIKQIATGFTQEATQESAQQAISQEKTDQERNAQYFKDIGISALIGGIVGGMGSAGRVGAEKLTKRKDIQPKTAESIPAPAKDVLQPEAAPALPEAPSEAELQAKIDAEDAAAKAAEEKPAAQEPPAPIVSKPNDFINSLTPEQKDPMTGLANKAYIDERKKQSPDKDMGMVDGDQFKLINDVYGHDAGDVIIKAIGYELQQYFPTAEIGRTGGEEFVIVFNETPDEAQLKKFITDVSENVKTPDGEPFTLSIGIGKGFKKDAKGVDRLYADELLYKAKEGGRNKIVLDKGGKLIEIKGREIKERLYVTKGILQRQLGEQKELLTNAPSISPNLRNSIEGNIQAIQSELDAIDKRAKSNLPGTSGQDLQPAVTPAPIPVKPEVKQAKPSREAPKPAEVAPNWEIGQERPFSVDPNSPRLKNPQGQIRFRLWNPKDIKPKSYSWGSTDTKGIRELRGIDIKSGKQVVQALRFDPNITEDQARAWYEKNKDKYSFQVSPKTATEVKPVPEKEPAAELPELPAGMISYGRDRSVPPKVRRGAGKGGRVGSIQWIEKYKVWTVLPKRAKQPVGAKDKFKLLQNGESEYAGQTFGPEDNGVEMVPVENLEKEWKVGNETFTKTPKLDKKGNIISYEIADGVRLGSVKPGTPIAKNLPLGETKGEEAKLPDWVMEEQTGEAKPEEVKPEEAKQPEKPKEFETRKFTSKIEAQKWVNENKPTSAKLQKVDTELYNLEVPKAKPEKPYSDNWGWYLDVDDNARYTTPKDPDMGYGLRGPYTRKYIIDTSYLKSPQEAYAVEKKAKAGNIEKYKPEGGGKVVEEKKPAPPETVKTKSEVKGQEVQTKPSIAQAEAGNYKKGHVTRDGMDISIENPAGSHRLNKETGEPHPTAIKHDYGYIRSLKIPRINESLVESRITTPNLFSDTPDAKSFKSHIFNLGKIPGKFESIVSKINASLFENLGKTSRSNSNNFRNRFSAEAIRKQLENFVNIPSKSSNRSIDSVFDETIPNCISAYSKFFGNTGNALSVFSKGYDFVSVDVKSVVKRNMLSFLKNREVFDSVIDFIPIDVVNYFARKEGASNKLLDNNTMLFNVITSPSYFDNPIIIGRIADSIASGLPIAFADDVAKRIGTTINLRPDSFKGISAEGTNNVHNNKYIYFSPKGKDKDHLDVFINPGSKEGGTVFVVNQKDPKTGKFDEHKVMIGFDSEDEAKKAYESNYEKGWKGFDSVVAMPMEQFKEWAYSDKPSKGKAEAPIKPKAEKESFARTEEPAPDTTDISPLITAIDKEFLPALQKYVPKGFDVIQKTSNYYFVRDANGRPRETRKFNRDEAAMITVDARRNRAVVFINPNAKPEQVAEIIKHELRHFGLRILQFQNPGVLDQIDKFMESDKDSEFYRNLKAMYPDATKSVFREEWLIRRLNMYEKGMTSKTKDASIIAKVYHSMKQWIKKMLNAIGRWNPTTQDEIFNKLIMDMKSLRPNKLEAEIEPTGNTGELQPAFGKPISKNLVALHNLTADKLIHADELGGFAMPSLAVTRNDIGFTNFGDISLIANRSTIDPKINRNAKTFDADIYSPRYPEMKVDLDSKKFKDEYNAPAQELADIVKNDKDYSAERFVEKVNSYNGKPWTYANAVLDQDYKAKDYKYDQVLMYKFAKENNIDFGGTFAGLESAVRSKENVEEFENYVDSFLEKLTIKRKFFKGFTYSGNRRYADYNLENILSEMKKELRGGEGFNYGAGSVRSQVAKKFTSVEKMKEESGRILSREKSEKIKDKFQNMLSEIASSIAKTRDFKRDFGDIDNVVTGIMEGIKRNNIRKELESYSFHPSDEDMQNVYSFLEDIKKSPTEYFESKIIDVVPLREFSGAVIPKTSGKRVRDVLNKNGIKYVEYDSAIDGDRANKVREFSETEDLAFGKPVPADTFFSPTLRAVEALKQEKGVVPQLLSMIKNGQLKKAEVEWMGLEDYLKEHQKATRTEVADFVRSNQVTVEEVKKGEGNITVTPLEDEPYILQVFRADDPTGDYSGMVGEIIDTKNGGRFKTPESKRFAVNVPSVTVKSFDTQKEAENYIKQKTDFATETKYSQYVLPGGENYREVFVTMPKALESTGPKSLIQYDWKDGHPGYEDVVNPIIRFRANDRVGPDGEKVLFIEELQKPTHNAQKDMPEIAKKYAYEIGIKKILRMAAEEGYDRVSWISGAQTVDRYNLSKQIDALNWIKTPDNVMISGFKNKEKVIEKNSVKPSELAGVIGKDAAQKIIDSPEKGGTLEGQDLKVQAAWAINLYDKQLPDIMNKIGKKFGAKVELIELPTGKEDTASENKPITDWEIKEVITPQQSLPITEAMRESVLYEGQPLFAKTTIDYQFTKAEKESLKNNPNVFWHGSMTGDLRGGSTGLHLGTYKAAKQALEARIGVPATGEWDGTREYGKTLLMGKTKLDALAEQGIYKRSGYNVDAPAEDYYPTKKPGDYVEMTDKPNILPYRLTGNTTNSRYSPHSDIKANALMKGQIKKGIQKSGFFYINDGEDAGSVSIVVPNGSFVEQIKPQSDQPAFAKLPAEQTDLFGRTAGQTEIAEEITRRNAKAQEKAAKDRGLEGTPLAEQESDAEAESQQMTLFMKINPEGDIDGSAYNENGQVSEKTKDSLLDSINDWLQSKKKFREESFQDSFIRAMQEKFIHLKHLEEKAGDNLPDELKVYQKTKIYKGKAGAKLTEFNEKHVQPLIKAIQESKVSINELDLYMYAKAAPKRNEYISGINAEFVGEEGNLGGSGMTDQESADILKAFADAGMIPKLEALAQKVYAIRDKTTGVLYNGGLVNARQIMAWKRDFGQYHVPMRGFEEKPSKDEKPSFPNVGKGFNVPSIKHALGRRSRADNITANIIMGMNEAIMNSEKNEVGKAFKLLIQDHPEITKARVITEKATRYFDKSTREVKTRISEAGPGKNILKVYESGEPTYVEIGDPLIARAILALHPQESSVALKIASKANRVMSALYTSFAPEFVISNFVRDLQTSMLNLSAEQADGIARNTFKDIPKALAGAYGALNGKEETEWQKWFKEFAKAGGKIEFFSMENPEEIEKSMEKRIKELNGQTNKALAVGKSIAEWVSNANGAVENATRLAVYVNMRKSGKSMDEAASIARDITVDFNKGGEASAGLNALYMFANASVQGTARLLRFLSSKKGMKYAGKIALSGLLASELARLMMGDDDDGASKYDKIPDWVRNNNLIIPNPLSQKGYTKIPLPYGYSAFYGIGQNISNMIHGQSVFDTGLAISGAVVNAFNPLGASSSAFQTFTPSQARVMVDLALNKNFFGSQIYKEKMYSREPYSQLYGDNASALSIALSKATNWVSGGDTHISGSLDIPPEAIDYLLAFYAGGFLSNIGQVTSIGKKLVTGDIKHIGIRQIPFLRKVYGTIDDYQTIKAFYDNSNKVADIKRNYDSMKADSPEAKKYMEKNAKYLTPLSTGGTLATLFENADKDLTKYRSDRKDAAAKGDRAGVEAAEKKMLDKAIELNKKYYGK